MDIGKKHYRLRSDPVSAHPVSETGAGAYKAVVSKGRRKTGKDPDKG